MAKKHTLCHECEKRPVGAIRFGNRWRLPRDNDHTLCRKCYQAQIDRRRAH